MARTLLVTGFEAYGGRGRNPSAEVAASLDGKAIGDHAVTGRTVSVDHSELRGSLARMVEEVDPAAMLCLGLWPGEPVVRLERIAVNDAVFEIPDNRGEVLFDQRLERDGPLAREARLPLRRIEAALIDRGVPVRLSHSAGTFLCNAIMYHALGLTGEAPCGFIHLPYLPEQVSELMRTLRQEQALELHQRADLASMSLETMIAAVACAAEVTLTGLKD